MGRALLVCRLAARDLRRRPGEAALLLLAIMAATTTLTLGLALHGVMSKPYQSTRKATAGPDVVAGVVPPIAHDRHAGPPVFGDKPANVAGLKALAGARGVVAHSGPYPVLWITLKARGHAVNAQVQGRDTAPARLDQPKLTQGRWVGHGGVVLEAAFAEALGLRAGDPITLEGRSFRVAGVAVTAASSPYPDVSCLAFCIPSGLVWTTRADARGLAPPRGQLAYVLDLKLADPAAAPAFAAARNRPQGGPPGSPASGPDRPQLLAWQDVRRASDHLVRNQRRALLTGSWLLGLLAVASVAVLVGGRMADQTRRVGLLKAIGGTPSLIAAVLLAEYLAVALLAAAAGLAVGWLAAPLLIDSSAGLLGRASAPPLTVSAAGLVTAVALGVAVAATFVPAVRAARTSTVLALADSARAPRRTGWLIAISARLPVPLLLGLRVAARRPRRMVLAIVSIAITVSGIVAALAAHIDLEQGAVSSVAAQSRTDQFNEVLLVITLTLVALATVNTVFITWATALDARRSSALARALGATPQQVSAGISAAQVLPALAGAVLGIPGGIGLFVIADPDPGTVVPPAWQLVAVVVSTVLLVAGLTAIPARAGARRPAAEILQSELA